MTKQPKTVRFTKAEANRITSQKVPDVVLGKDKRGYFIEGHGQDTQPDPLGALIKGLLRQAKPAMQGEEGPRDGRRVGRTVPLSSGICAQVRQWAKDHPDASVHDAVEAFKDANSTTVRIQFNKAH